MPVVEDNHIVQELSATATDPSLGHRIVPGTTVIGATRPRAVLTPWNATTQN